MVSLILVIIGRADGFLPVWHQAITWTIADLMPIEPLRTHLNEIWIKLQWFQFKKMHLKLLSAKWQPFCSCPNVWKGIRTSNTLLPCCGFILAGRFCSVWWACRVHLEGSYGKSPQHSSEAMFGFPFKQRNPCDRSDCVLPLVTIAAVIVSQGRMQVWLNTVIGHGTVAI